MIFQPGAIWECDEHELASTQGIWQSNPWTGDHDDDDDKDDDNDYEEEYDTE